VQNPEKRSGIILQCSRSIKPTGRVPEASGAARIAGYGAGRPSFAALPLTGLLNSSRCFLNQLQLGFWDCELRRAAIQTHGDLREDPNQRLVLRGNQANLREQFLLTG